MDTQTQYDCGIILFPLPPDADGWEQLGPLRGTHIKQERYLCDVERKWNRYLPIYRNGCYYYPRIFIF